MQEDMNQGDTRISRPVEETGKAGRPSSVIVFGILNIVFVSAWWLHLPHGPFLFFVPFALPVAFSIWLIVLAIGFFSLLKWARRGAIIYAWIEIGWSVVQFAPALASILSGHGYNYIPMILPGGGPIYSIILIVFMRSKNMKNAFGR